MGNDNSAPNGNINGINSSQKQKPGSGQNSSPDALSSLLGNTFVTNDGSGDTTFAKAIAPNKVIGLYFSAHWCPPCRKFTPYLKQLYEEWKKENHQIEIVFVSGDKSPDAFKSYFNTDHGNWLALPFGSQQINAINQRFQVRGIPALIFVDNCGNIVEMNGRNLVQQQGASAIHVLMQNIPEVGASTASANAFQGTGHSLKDSADTDQAAGKGNSISMYDYIASKELKIFDDQDPTAKVQVVLANGTKKTVELNVNKQNVGDLYAHVKWLHDPGSFQLLAGFPPKLLSDETMTIGEAKLQGTRVTQKTL